MAFKEDISITPHLEATARDSFKAKVRVRQNYWQCMVSANAYDRYCDWNNSSGKDENRNDGRKCGRTGDRHLGERSATRGAINGYHGAKTACRG